MPKLGVNVDHIATLRQARKAKFPDPVYAAQICEKTRCDSIVAHLREDRRHINDADIARLKKALKLKFNLEMSASREIVKIACALKPDQATLVPEKRKELTTEGGLDLISQKRKIRRAIVQLQKNGIQVSLFIDPDIKQIEQAADIGGEIIEIHTGRYAEAKTKTEKITKLQEIKTASAFAKKQGLIVCAGHGLDYDNVTPIAKIEEIEELNIGYSIICRSIFVGLKTAVKEMLKLCEGRVK